MGDNKIDNMFTDLKQRIKEKPAKVKEILESVDNAILGQGDNIKELVEVYGYLVALNELTLSLKKTREKQNNNSEASDTKLVALTSSLISRLNNASDVKTATQILGSLIVVSVASSLSKDQRIKLYNIVAKGKK